MTSRWGLEHVHHTMTHVGNRAGDEGGGKEVTLESLSLCCEWITVPAVQRQPWRAPLCRARWGIFPGLLICFDSRFPSLAWVTQCYPCGFEGRTGIQTRNKNRWKRLACTAGKAKNSIMYWNAAAGSDSRLSLWHFGTRWQEGDGSFHCSFPWLSQGGNCQRVLISRAPNSAAVYLCDKMNGHGNVRFPWVIFCLLWSRVAF